MTQQLLQRYINDQCSAAEKKQVAHWLCTCSEAELEELMQERWREVFATMPEEEATVLWRRLKQELQPDHNWQSATAPTYTIWKRLAVAAVVILIGMIAARLLLPGNRKTDVNEKQAAAVISKDTAAIHWTVLENKNSEEQFFLLEDSTRVILYKNARLSFTEHFAPGHRTVHLTGKGLFNVAKDIKRPFTVISDQISTTALGTQFLVNNNLQDKRILVKLLEGKVVVKHTGQQYNNNDAVYLAPGETLTADSNGLFVKTQPVRNEMIVKAAKEQEVKTATGEELSFSNATLEEVFVKLEKRFRQAIRFNKQDISGKYFTGNIAATDSLVVVLKLVAEMNGLKVQQDDHGYSISKSPE